MVLGSTPFLLGVVKGVPRLPFRLHRGRGDMQAERVAARLEEQPVVVHQISSRS
jgi:hypothetical protein